MKTIYILLVLLFCAAALPLRAQDFSVNAFGDLSLVKQSDQTSWENGGLGKLRYGGDGESVQLAQIVADARLKLDPDILAFATVRYAPDQKTALDILESYIRYQPLSTAPIQWSFKIGAFYPPISLENEGTGWTSPWTITPSAINSWVGEELRALGGEGTVTWQYDGGTVSGTGSVFGWDDPAGTILTDRGWAFGDRPSGLFDQLRLPDAFARANHKPTPDYSYPFIEIDNSPGWYGAVSWTETGVGRISAMRYENRADPTKFRDGQIGWQTDFTSLGMEADIGDVVLLAQGMIGDTEIDPSPRFHMVTRFESAYLLAGWDIGDWTLAGRADVFMTSTPINANASEHGNGLTAALTWRPQRWLRLTAELLQVDSTRTQRITAGLSPQADETQLQLLARFIY